MTPVEREHIIAAYTFELSKCYEQAIKERALQVLANIDPELCEGVAAGLGLPAPEADRPLASVDPSPALSQIGRSWPLDGRIIGIVADDNGDLDGSPRPAPEQCSTPAWSPWSSRRPAASWTQNGEPITVQRTFATARSIEFDAVLLAGTPGPGKDAYGARDAKAGDPAVAGRPRPTPGFC